MHFAGTKRMHGPFACLTMTIQSPRRAKPKGNSTEGLFYIPPSKIFFDR